MFSERLTCRLDLRAILCIPFLLCSGCFSDQSQPPHRPLRVFAAASLSTVIPEIAEEFQTRHPDIEFEFNFAASSMLAKQIEHGAAADLYLSANTNWVHYLEERSLIERTQELLSNKLVLVTPIRDNATQDLRLANLAGKGIRKIALADWSHVPAGIYARQALEKAGLWDAVASKCLPALDVRAALTYVERGEADCGLVYRTDAAISNKVRIEFELPAQLQPRIRYMAALPKTSQHQLSTLFFAFLSSDTAGQIFTRHGFGLIGRE